MIASGKDRVPGFTGTTNEHEKIHRKGRREEGGIDSGSISGRPKK